MKTYRCQIADCNATADVEHESTNNQAPRKSLPDGWAQFSAQYIDGTPRTYSFVACGGHRELWAPITGLSTGTPS